MPTATGTRAPRAWSNARSAGCALWTAVVRATPPAQPASAGPRTLADLYRDHRLRLVRLAVLLVDDPGTAEDVVQEAFAGLHRHWAGLRDEAAALAYLRAAVVNGSRSVLRRRRTARDYVPPHQVNARSAESLALLSAEHQAVVDALGTLPPTPARGPRPALLRRAVGGRDRRRDRHQPRHREVDGEQGAGRRAARDGRPDRQGVSSLVDGRDADGTAAGRRLAEAMRAQASFTAGPPQAPPRPHPAPVARSSCRHAASRRPFPTALLGRPVRRGSGR